MNKITAVVLASGLSSRMGCNKLLLETDGKPLIMHVLELLKTFDFQEVLVVTGYDEIIKLADKMEYRTVFNDAPEIGQSHSVVLGVSASRNPQGWLFLNGDMPWLKSDTIQRILDAAEHGKNIVVPRYHGHPGQPVYFPVRFYEELKKLTGDQGGRQIIRQHPEAVIYVDIEEQQQGIDIDTPEDYKLYQESVSGNRGGSRMNRRIVIRGGGDLATGTISCLHQCGYQVLVLEIEKPTAIRRSVAFSEAMYDGETVVEGIKARRIECWQEAEQCWKEHVIPIMKDETAACVKEIAPMVFIDAAIAKKNLGTTIDMAPLVIGLGPGFTAGVDVHLVIETKRGHRLGRIIREGAAIANTGIPGIIGGYGKERVIHSPAAGIFTGKAHIGDIVARGDLIAYVGEVPVYASLDGILRGLLRDGLEIPERFKIADIDPRLSEKDNCYTISDKARAIAGGVLQAVCIYEYEKRTGEGSN